MFARVAAVALLFAVPALAQTPADSAADRAAAAAQKAAEAAAAAADAAAKSAAAAEKAASAMAAAKPPEVAVVVAAPAAAPAAPAAPPEAIWTGLVGIGLISVTGNANALTFNANAAFERKSTDWIWGLKANASYGQGTPVGSNVKQTTAEAASALLRGDRRFNEQLSGYLLAGIDTDHIKNIEERPYGEVGASLIWFDEKSGPDPKTAYQKATLRTDLGFRYGHEYRFIYFPAPARQDGVDIVAPHAGALFRYAITKEIIFTQDADVVPNLVGDARLLITANSKLAARLTAQMNLGVTFTIHYDSLPPFGADGVTRLGSTDTALAISLEVGL